MNKKRMIALVVVLGLTAMYLLHREDLDRFNPLFAREDVYVQINQSPKPDNRRFKYRLTGHTSEGQEKKVIFTASVELNKGAYLKLDAKGRYTQSWEQVDPDTLPSGVPRPSR